jgi:hypothetical protein
MGRERGRERGGKGMHAYLYHIIALFVFFVFFVGVGGWDVGHHASFLPSLPACLSACPALVEEEAEEEDAGRKGEHKRIEGQSPVLYSSSDDPISHKQQQQPQQQQQYHEKKKNQSTARPFVSQWLVSITRLSFPFLFLI